MLAQAELVASACDFFPEHCVFRDVDLETTWHQAVKSYNKRLKELQKGIVLAEGIAPENVEPVDGEGEIHSIAEDVLRIRAQVQLVLLL